ncbi:MAG: hypothetical protein R6U15_03710, partial [Candidatus Izemoplasmatales bacterium]
LQRQHFEHTDSGDDVIYNSSNELWEIHTPYIYTQSGTYEVYANCSHNTTSAYDNNVVEELEIIGRLPTIFIEQVNNTNGLVMLYDGVEIEYDSNVWQWFGACVNCEGGFNVSWTYPNGTALQSYLNQNGSTQLETNAELFREINNPYNITINASNIEGNITIETLQFNVTDTFAPICTVLEDDSVLNNTEYEWDITCSDESFFSFNMTCDNGFNYYIEGLNVQSFNFINSTVIDDITTCTYRACDGHTSEELKKTWKIKDDKDKQLLEFDVNNQKHEIYYDSNVNMSYEVKKDRVSFKVKKSDKNDNTIRLVYKTKGLPYYFDSIKYDYWIVDGKAETWFDLNSFDVNKEDIKMKKLDSYTYQFDIITDKEEITFNSIGELNCFTDTQILSPTQFATDFNYFGTEYCPLEQELAWALTWLGLVLLILIFFVINLAFIKIPFVSFMIGLAFIIVTLPLYSCYVLVGATFTIIGFIIMMIDFWLLFMNYYKK